jgi:signal transduction histidine kinase
VKPGAPIQVNKRLAQGGSNPAMRLMGAAYPNAALSVQAALLGYAYYVLSIPAAYTTNANTLAAIIWPAPALAAALLWRKPYRQWPIFLLGIFLAMMSVGNLDELSLGADSAFAVLDVFQAAFYGWVGRRFVSDRGELDTSRKLARFMVFLPLLCTGVVAVLGATIGTLTKQTLWLDEWRVMMVGNGLAVLVLLPALLAWCPPDGTAQAADVPANDWKTPTIAALLTLLLLTGSTVVQGFSAEVLRALLSLVLVWAAIHGGLRAAASGMLVATTAGIGLTWANLGPYASPLRYDGIWALQIDLAGLAVLSFFVAIAVHEKQKLNVRLDRARRFESIGLLAGGIAHDFNNILGAVGGYAELASEQLSAGGTARGSLREVSLAVSRGKELTEQILQAGKQGQRVRRVLDFRDVVIQSASLARPLMPAGIHMTLSVPAEPVLIALDEAQLVRALLNLIRNASQAAATEVTISLHMSQTNGAAVAGADHIVGEVLDEVCAWADITDDGAGIPPGHIHQLFDPFFSSRAAGSNQGTGLGLAIVAGVATDHAGGVAVWSGHGAATRFRFMLPLAPNGALFDAPAATLPGQGQTVLLLQPDTALREHHEEALAVLGFEPVGYAKDIEVLAALAQSPKSFFLMLMGEPAADGQQDTLLEKIHGLAPALAIIACAPDTDSASITQTAHCVKVPASFDDAVLRKAVTMAIGADCQPGAHPPIANQSL